MRFLTAWYSEPLFSTTVPQWLAALGTIASVITALVIAWNADKKAKKAQADVDEERRLAAIEKHKTQAVAIAAWLDIQSVAAADKVTKSHEKDIYYSVRNDSPSPIFNVLLTLWDRRAPERVTIKQIGRVLPAGKQLEGFVDSRDKAEWQKAGHQGEDYMENYQSQINFTIETLDLSLEFQDFRGTTWRRYLDGSLEEADDEGEKLSETGQESGRPVKTGN